MVSRQRYLLAIGWIVNNHDRSKYKTQPLQDAMVSAYSKNELLFGGFRAHASYRSDLNVTVTSTSASGLAVNLAKYNRLCGEKCWRSSNLCSITIQDRLSPPSVS